MKRTARCSRSHAWRRSSARRKAAAWRRASARSRSGASVDRPRTYASAARGVASQRSAASTRKPASWRWPAASLAARNDSSTAACARPMADSTSGRSWSRFRRSPATHARASASRSPSTTGASATASKAGGSSRGATRARSAAWASTTSGARRTAACWASALSQPVTRSWSNSVTTTVCSATVSSPSSASGGRSGAASWFASIHRNRRTRLAVKWSGGGPWRSHRRLPPSRVQPPRRASDATVPRASVSDSTARAVGPSFAGALAVPSSRRSASCAGYAPTATRASVSRLASARVTAAIIGGGGRRRPAATR